MNSLHIAVSGMWLQGGDAFFSSNSTVLMILVGLVAFALMVQAIAIIAIAVGAAKARKHTLEILDELKVKVLPMIGETHSLVRETSPKLKIIADNLMETSHVVRSKAVEADATLTDMNERTRAQVAKLDSIVGKTLNATGDAIASVERVVRAPAREFAGVMNGFRAGLGVLLGRMRNGHGDAMPPEQNREL